MSENQQTMEAAPVARKATDSKVGKPEMFRLGIALFGGIRVLNCYLSRVFFSNAIDETARDGKKFVHHPLYIPRDAFKPLIDLLKHRVG